MKRKIKLLTSIASLSLAFAMMAVGIFAATARTATVSGSLSFTSDRTAAKIEVSYVGPSADAITSSTTFPAATEANTINLTRASGTDTGSVNIGNFALKDSTPYAGIKVVITNTDVSTISVVTTLPTGIGSSTFSLAQGSASSTPITTTNSTTYIIAISYLLTANNTSSNLEFSISFAISK